MILTLDLDSDRPLFLQVADAIKRSLAHGEIGPGDQLPAGRELAMSLDVSLETVQRAYRQLAEQDIVTSRVGRGTRIANTVDPTAFGIEAEVRQLVDQARNFGISKTQLLQVITDAY